MISVWCDGSSNGRSGSPTGWAYIIERDGEVLYSSHGYEESGTNSTAELTACLEGLLALKVALKEIAINNEQIVLVSDSLYALNAASGATNATKNLHIVVPLQQIFAELNASTRHVYGHSGFYLNEVCDKLAKRGRNLGNLSKKRNNDS